MGETAAPWNFEFHEADFANTDGDDVMTTSNDPTSVGAARSEFFDAGRTFSGELSAMVYAGIRSRLDRPRRQVWSSKRLLERLHPHEPSPDPQWPTPTTIGEVRQTVARLQNRLLAEPEIVWVLCAATAAELALHSCAARPITPANRRDNEPRVNADASEMGESDGEIGGVAPVERALRGVWDWLSGEAPISAVIEAQQTANEYLEPADGAGHSVIWTCIAAKHIDQARQSERNRARHAMSALSATENAIRAAAQFSFDPATFLGEWWARCRCRLAVAEWTGIDWG